MISPSLVALRQWEVRPVLLRNGPSSISTKTALASYVIRSSKAPRPAPDGTPTTHSLMMSGPAPRKRFAPLGSLNTRTSSSSCATAPARRANGVAVAAGDMESSAAGAGADVTSSAPF